MDTQVTIPSFTLNRRMERTTKTLAAILVEQNQNLIVDEIELPQQLGVGQVMVKLITSGICGSQIGEIKGVKGDDKYLPHLMGHEGFAEVVEVGPGVKHVQKDDNVVLHWRPGAGIQSETPRYKWHNKIVNAGWVTTFNQHAVVSENRCTKVPKDTNPAIAALFGCAVTTGFGVIENNAKLKMGESIVVFGAGGIGLNIVQGASLVSGSPIIAVDRFDKRLELAKQMGATHCINSEQVNVKDEISKILGRQTLDVFVDNTGIPKIIEIGYQLVHKKGRVVLVGVPRKGHEISLYSLPLHFGKQLIGSEGGDSIPQYDILRYLRLEEQGMINLEELIGSRYKLHEINEAIRDMCDGETAGRIIIEF